MEDNRTRVAIGTMARPDVVQAERVPEAPGTRGGGVSSTVGRAGN